MTRCPRKGNRRGEVPRSTRRLLCLVGLGLVLAPNSAAAAPLVIWLSFDGVRHDYPDRGEFDGLDRISREGVRADRLVPDFPTSTFPNHVSQATCARVDRHGIVANRFFDPQLGEFDYENDARFINAEPIWITAERQGVAAASFFWVGSETPWRGTAATYRKRPFDPEIGEAEKVDQILEWIDLPEEVRPGLVLSWWHGADGVGHRRGPDHRAVAEQLSRQDAQLGRLLDGLDARNAWSFATLIVSSDHGMTSGQIEIDIDDVVSESGVSARYHSDGAVAYVSIDDARELPKLEAALASIDGHRVYRSDSLPLEFRIASPGRIGDLVLVAEPPHFYASSSATKKWVGRLLRFVGFDRGVHGYSPDHPDMAGIFYAVGRGVVRETPLGAVSNLDIAPSVSRLLGIDPPADCEGRALDALGGVR